MGVVGFSLGGTWALRQADQARAVVTFYGVGDPESGKPDVAYQGHFAELDKFDPPEVAREIEETLRNGAKEVEFHIYESAHHWFFEEDRPEHFNPRAAHLAWDRMLRFLHRHLSA